MAKKQSVADLKKRIQKLEDENAQLQYWAQIHYQWAVGHNAERMADLERHKEQLRLVMKLQKYDRKRYDRFIKRDTKAFFKRMRDKRAKDIANNLALN